MESSCVGRQFAEWPRLNRPPRFGCAFSSSAMFGGAICFTVWSIAASGCEFNMLGGLLVAAIMSYSLISSVLNLGLLG